MVRIDKARIRNSSACGNEAFTLFIIVKRERSKPFAEVDDEDDDDEEGEEEEEDKDEDEDDCEGEQREDEQSFQVKKDERTECIKVRME